MTAKGTRVRDYTTGGQDLEVDVVHGEVYETLTALYAVPDCVDHGTDYDDSGLIDRMASRLDDDLSQVVVNLKDSWSLYLGLIGIAYEEGLGASMTDFVAHLRALDPMELRRIILEAGHPKSKDPELLERAVDGDAEAIDAVLGDHHEGLRRFLGDEPEASVTHLIRVIEGFHDQALRPELESVLPTLERDAADKALLSKTLTPELFVEKATNGITFEPGPGVENIVLVPSIVIRPWTLLVEHGSTRLFIYSVDEEVINADPAAPPAYLVELYKALGDERRLRLLAELWFGESDLKSLAQKLDIAKSTVHHHLRALRTAGLVRVILRDTDKVYGLRKEALPDAGPLLEDFLNRLKPKE
jgi:DNA-binding transcriptional ArsR family regulator